ncbi:MAG: hypothetical protein COX30_02875 [Candidatus Moranbacteria bacterium CG23_combo_of_CG06-09_8_20_14_all_39_10]|nr:MAG: hypothetical protein COX30_02875 [Candidatus Moranbacteria bacterium CG23_combo_of_CG06-09_8_20_14_all_39_10]
MKGTKGGKVKYHNLTENQKKKYLGEFYSTIALLKTKDEAKRFFKDLLTLSEVVMISRRIQVAKMLLEGRIYEDIKKELKIGTTTISQVEKWLFNGFGGYKEVLDKHKNNKNKNNKPAFEFEIFPATLKKKYPAYFLLSNLLKKK